MKKKIKNEVEIYNIDYIMSLLSLTHLVGFYD